MTKAATKWASNVKTHKANVHDIDVTFYLCGVGACEYKAKTASNLNTHKAMVHEIDVHIFLMRCW